VPLTYLHSLIHVIVPLPYSHTLFHTRRQGSECDNLLLEMRLALELRDRGLVEKVRH
jgi:hypothetical protein